MEWDDAFDLGIKEFDDHHKHLVYLLNLTYDGFTLGAGQDEILAVLDELADYATHHFAAEEYWMKEHEYSGLSQHSEEHEKFSNRVMEFQRDFHQGNTNLSFEVIQFLVSWLTTHILNSDADYGQFAKEQSHIVTCHT